MKSAALALSFAFAIQVVCIHAQANPPGSPGNRIIGMGRGTDEKAATVKAERDGVRMAVQNLLGPNAPMDSPKIAEFVKMAEARQFLKPENASKPANVRKEGKEFVAEIVYAVDWDALRSLLDKRGILEQRGQAGPGQKQNLPEIVFATGRGKEEAAAKEKAARIALRVAVEALSGPQPVNKQAMEDFIMRSDPGAFLVPEGPSPFKVRKEGAEVVADYAARARWDLLKERLVQAGIMVPKEGAPAGNQPRQDQKPGTGGSGTEPMSAGISDKGAVDWGTVTEAEKNIILKYLDTLSFMVYFNETSLADKAMLKAAVSRANTVLTRAGITVFDINRVEALKADQMKVYQSSSGGSVNFIQWVAQKLNADIYVQIDVITGSNAKAVMTQDTAATDAALTVGVLTTDLFDASSGQLMGSASNTIIATNPEETKDATSLVLNVVSQAMVQVVAQAKEQMQKALVRGMRYELIIQHTPDSRQMSSFLTEIKAKTKQIKVLSSSPTEYRYEVYYIGLISDLESLIYEISDKVTSLKDVSLVMASGKTLTMDTGIR